MVFSSVPTHLDPPNWNQQQVQPGQRPSVVVDANHHQHQLPPVWPSMAPQFETRTPASGRGSSVQPGLPTSGGGSGSSVRPGSMAERARLAKIPLPEPGLKCPRCDSTNTKFCYFNNYSLSQPRHFCKACRRYWTRGGALRSVPVGGVCRRNKRKKSSKHSSSCSASASATSATATPSSAAAGVMPPQLQPHIGSLDPIWSDLYSAIGASRIGFPGLSNSLHPAVDYQLSDGLGIDRWRLQPAQQFPFLTPGDAVTPLPPDLSLKSSVSYPFDESMAAGSVVEAVNLAGQMPAAGANVTGSGGLIKPMCSVKMDDNPPSVATSSPREFLDLRGSSLFCDSGENGSGGYSRNGAGGTGIIGGGAAPGVLWSDLSAFNSPPPGNLP